jgi:hypothetical protein
MCATPLLTWHPYFKDGSSCLVLPSFIQLALWSWAQICPKGSQVLNKLLGALQLQTDCNNTLLHPDPFSTYQFQTRYSLSQVDIRIPVLALPYCYSYGALNQINANTV